MVMTRAWVLLGCAGLATGGLLLACNGLLGITEAKLEPAEAGQHEAGSAEGGAGDAGAADGAGVEAGPFSSYVLDCATYCRVIGSNCRVVGTQSDTEYLSDQVCNAICPLFERAPTASGSVDPNEPTPMTDTLNCRIWHANAAQGGPAENHTHCPHAGPLGGNMCGMDPCQAFCNLDLALCTGDAAAYGSVAECLSACEPDGGDGGFAYKVNPNDPEVTDLVSTGGNTLNCRMYHLENYLLTGQAIHCSHTSQGGNGVCVN
jgi:hypothetical protein